MKELIDWDEYQRRIDSVAERIENAYHKDKGIRISHKEVDALRFFGPLMHGDWKYDNKRPKDQS